MEMMDMAADDTREELRRKLRSNFDGRIVRKDLTKKIKEGVFTPILQSSSWTYTRTAGVTQFQTVTWGVGQDGELGGTIENTCWILNSNGVKNVNESNRNTAKGIAHIGMIVNENTLFKGATITRIR